MPAVTGLLPLAALLTALAVCPPPDCGALQEKFGYVSLSLMPIVLVAMAAGPRLQRSLGLVS
jgi:hypothetical protein